MAKYRINPAPGNATGWGRFRSGQEYELTDAQVEKFTRRGIIGEPKVTTKSEDAAPIVEAPMESLQSTHIGPKFQPQPDAGEKEKEKKSKPGRNATTVGGTAGTNN